MSEMITRVAKAIFLSQHPGAEWSAGRARIVWFHMAEAAIEAMREPTAIMIASAAMSAVEDETPSQEGLGTVLELLPPTGHPDGPAVLADIRRDYRAMIDAASR